MEVTNDGVPIGSLIDAVKTAVKAAGISSTDTDRAIQVVSVQLVLNAMAIKGGGARLEFMIPFIGSFRLGTRITVQDTHTIDITLVPSDLAPKHEIRGAEVEERLVEAIETVTAVMAQAAGGDDPFLLKESTIELTFAVTEDGSISLVAEGEAKHEITHKLKLTLAVAL